MKKGFTLSEIIVVIVVLFVVFWMLIGFLANIGNVLKHPQCLFSKDPVLCSVMMEKK
jgi:prepilin-type N-terminal cleavage/methylation domain-containing protein